MTNDLCDTLKRNYIEIQLLTKWLTTEDEECFAQVQMLGIDFIKDRINDLQKMNRTNPIWENEGL